MALPLNVLAPPGIAICGRSSARRARSPRSVDAIAQHVAAIPRRSGKSAGLQCRSANRHSPCPEDRAEASN